jgi:hypothetical protein
MPKLPAGQPRGDQRWGTFLRNHAKVDYKRRKNGKEAAG